MVVVREFMDQFRGVIYISCDVELVVVVGEWKNETRVA